MTRMLSIGQLARATSVAARTIRYYETVGVLPPPGRTRSGYRQYERQAVEQLLFIRRARALGLPLRHLGKLWDAAKGERRGGVRSTLLTVVRQHLAAVEQKITELNVLKHELEQIVRRISFSPSPDDAGVCRCLDVDENSCRTTTR